MKIRELKGILSELKAIAEIVDSETDKASSKPYKQICEHLRQVLRNMEPFFNGMYFALEEDEHGIPIFYIYDDVRQREYTMRGTRAEYANLRQFKETAGNEWTNPVHYDCETLSFAIIFRLKQ